MADPKTRGEYSALEQTLGRGHRAGHPGLPLGASFLLPHARSRPHIMIQSCCQVLKCLHALGHAYCCLHAAIQPSGQVVEGLYIVEFTHEEQTVARRRFPSETGDWDAAAVRLLPPQPRSHSDRSWQHPQQYGGEAVE